MTKQKAKKLTDEQVLKKCVEIAVGNGWGFPCGGGFGTTQKNQLGVWYLLSTVGFSYSLESVIFSHPFAKALWGEEPIDKEGWVDRLEWEWYLQQMVLEKNPIDYLREWLRSG